MRRGEVNWGEREATGRELFWLVERGLRLGVGEGYRKKHPSPKAAGEKVEKVETASGTELKREKGERRGLKLH